MAMLPQDEIKAEIEAIVRERIRSGAIVAVSVDSGEDADGEDIIVVDVVFDSGDRPSLDPRETAQITRFVRNRLTDLDERRFPVFSFTAKTEAGDLAAA